MPLTPRPKIVTLCGSTRFKEEFIQANFRLTRQGIIVLTVGWFSHTDKEKWEPTEEEKKAFDELHLRKIDISDGIFVVNPVVNLCSNCGKPTYPYNIRLCKNGCGPHVSIHQGWYIGDSTKREIQYAKDLGLDIQYLTPH